MKKFIKSIGKIGTGLCLVGACAFLAPEKLEAQVGAAGSAVVITNLTAPLAGTNYTTNGIAILTNGGYYVSEIDVSQGAGASNAIVTFYDCTNLALQYTNTNSYVVKTEMTTNVTSVLTNNSTGTVFTNVYPGTYTIFTTNTGYTNTYPAISVFVSYPNGVQRRTGSRLALVNGLTATCSTSNVTVVVYYSPTF